jgi:hypothetical protein
MLLLVAPEQYSDLAKKDFAWRFQKEGFHSSFWTVNQFVANEITTSIRYFIGNTEENEFTKNMIPVTKSNLPDK